MIVWALPLPSLGLQHQKRTTTKYKLEMAPCASASLLSSRTHGAGLPQLPNDPKGTEYLPAPEPTAACPPERLWDSSSCFCEKHHLSRASLKPFHFAPDQQTVDSGVHTGVLSAQWRTRSHGWLVHSRHGNKRNSTRTRRAQHHYRKRNLDLVKIEQGNIWGLLVIAHLGSVI